jgi:cell division protein FtsQ
LRATDTRPAAAPIDPRLRARRIAVRRDEGRRRLHRLGILGVVAVVAVALVGITRSPLLDVDRVTVTGAVHTPVHAIADATGIRRHTPMTDVDLDAARRAVLALPWVRTVSIQRSWPSSVEVVVTERTPVAVVTAGSAGFALVDAAGRVLDVAPAPMPGFVLLSNVAATGPPGSTLDPSASNVLAVATTMPPALASQVSTVVANGADVTLRLAAGGVVRLGPDTDLGTKLRAALTVIQDVDLTNLCAIDVRVPSAPSLTRGEGCL